MQLSMADTAINPTLPDTGDEPEFRPTTRERLGVALFLTAAVVATATWIGLLVWVAILLIKQL